jgi:hypothetical protein
MTSDALTTLNTSLTAATVVIAAGALVCALITVRLSVRAVRESRNTTDQLRTIASELANTVRSLAGLGNQLDAVAQVMGEAQRGIESLLQQVQLESRLARYVRILEVLREIAMAGGSLIPERRVIVDRNLKLLGAELANLPAGDLPECHKLIGTPVSNPQTQDAEAEVMAAADACRTQLARLA